MAQSTTHSFGDVYVKLQLHKVAVLTLQALRICIILIAFIQCNIVTVYTETMDNLFKHFFMDSLTNWTIQAHSVPPTRLLCYKRA